MSHVTAVCTLLLLLACRVQPAHAGDGGAPLVSPSLSAVHTSCAVHALPPPVADDDSLKRAAEKQRLRTELEAQLLSLRAERDSLRAALDGAADPEAMESHLFDVENRISDIESRLRSLDDDWIIGDNERPWWEDEEEWDEDGNDWWDSDDGQFRMRADVFRKYPAVFRWLFPVDTRMGESFLRYNRVEGLYLGIAQPKRLYWHSKPKLVSTGSLGYGFASHRWRYSLGLYLPLYLEDQIIEFGGEGHSFTDSKDQWIIDRDENSVMAFFGREDFMDYFSREGYSASAAWYFRGDDDLTLRASLSYVHDTYRSLERNTNWSVFGGDKTFRVQPAIDDININSLVISTGASTAPHLSPYMHGWNVAAQYEIAGGGFKGDADFSQVIVDVRRYQPIADALNINVRARATASDGDLPLQRMVDLGGVSTLPGYRYKELTGTHGLLVNVEAVLRGDLIRGDTRGWLASALTSINLIVFADAGAVSSPSVDQNNPAAVPAVSMLDNVAFTNWKSDAGVALGSADGEFRIGAAWRLDRSSSPMFVLRFARPF